MEELDGNQAKPAEERIPVMQHEDAPPVHGKAKTRQIDLRLAELRATLAPGECLSCAEIASRCHCSAWVIRNAEERALKKLRRALQHCGIEYELQQLFPSMRPGNGDAPDGSKKPIRKGRT